MTPAPPEQPELLPCPFCGGKGLAVMMGGSRLRLRRSHLSLRANGGQARAFC
jgi:hypothetical protein